MYRVPVDVIGLEEQDSSGIWMCKNQGSTKISEVSVLIRQTFYTLESDHHVWTVPLYVYSTVRQRDLPSEGREQMQNVLIHQLEARTTC
jgi:hypothetical protein